MGKFGLNIPEGFDARSALMKASKTGLGLGQLGANLIGQGDAANNWIAQKEKEYQAYKASGQGNTASEVVGDLLDPASVATMKLMPFLNGASGFWPKAAQYAGNVGIGTAAGATLGLAQPTVVKDGTSYAGEKAGQVGENALGGAAVAGIVAPLVSGAAKLGGWAYDAMSGRRPDIKAAQIMRDVAGGKLPDIQTAMAAAPDNVTAAQAAYGIDRDTWMALGDMARRGDSESYYRMLADAQEAAQRKLLEGVAGGTTQTDARKGAIAAKDALNAKFVPQMNQELAAANEGQKLAQFQNEADRLAGAAANKVEDVRRFTNAGNIAEDVANSGRTGLGIGNVPPSGMPRLSGQYGYGSELAQRAESEATKAAGDSLILGEGARFSQSIADSLEKHGIAPLDVKPILAGLDARLANPTAAGNTKYQTVLSRVASDIQDWADANGGVIDARALYAIRKNSVNDVLESLPSGANPKASAKYAAQVLAEVRPMIDDAIVKAGGTEWPQTLKIFEEGMKPIERQKMGGAALELWDKSKNKFLRTIQGEEPKVVEKVFGPGRFDINKQMGDQMAPLQDVASQVMRDKVIEVQAKAGAGGLERILERDQPKFRIPQWISRTTTAANMALSELEKRTSRATMDSLVKGMRSGKDANQLLAIMPTSESKNLLAEIIRNGVYRNLMIPAESAMQSQ